MGFRQLGLLGSGFGQLGSSPAAGPAPAPPETDVVFGPIAVTTNSTTPGSYRFICRLDADSLGALKFKFAALDNQTFALDHASFGKWDGVEGRADITTQPIAITFNGGNAGIPAGTPTKIPFPAVEHAGAFESDIMAHPGLSLSAGDYIVATSDMPGYYLYTGAAANCSTLLFPGGATWDQKSPGSGGATLYPSLACGLFKVDTEAVPDRIDIPVSFDDPMFTDMTESTDRVSIFEDENLSRTSIVEFSGDPTISCVGPNTVSYCRVNSAECVRITTGDLTVDHCYLESTGSGEDHADTLQAYSPGARDGTVTIRNSLVVAHTTAATAGYFTADDWAGNIVLDTMAFQGGPFGLRVIAGATGSNINLSLKDVYFVGPFGTAPYILETDGSGTITVLQWDNVRSATIVDGVLIPGGPIAPPP